MIVPTKKPGTPLELAHFGVKGMRWGVRKSEFTQQHPTATKAIKIGGAAAVLVGAAVVAGVLIKHGQTNVVSLDSLHLKNAGKYAVESFSNKTMMKTMTKSGKSPSVASMKELASTLKANEYIIWDPVKNVYNVSKTQGYNPNTGAVAL